MNGLDLFAPPLLDAARPCPAGLRTWNGSDPGRRFDVYRNNVMVSLVDALADSYPVTQALVGEEFFRAMAGLFVRESPPRVPVMAWYGGGFARFVERFPPAAGLPYLADVARLEWLRVTAFHAAEAIPVDSDTMARLVADTAALPAARLELHPATGVIASPHAIVSLWSAHQQDAVDTALGQVDPALPEAALIVRPGLVVDLYRIKASDAEMISALRDNTPLGAAVARAQRLEPDFDPAPALGLLIRCGAIVAPRRGVAP